MNASSRRILRLGLTAGLSLGAIVGLVGCAEQMDDANATEAAAFESTNGLSLNGLSLNGWTQNGLSLNGLSLNGLSLNGLSLNGLSLNGLSLNGLSLNGLSLNGLSLNGLETAGGLSSTTGLMTTAGGREVIKYMVKCAYPTGASLTKQDQNGVSYQFDGAIGVAPELENGLCDVNCQERISGCMLAHVNNSGLHVGIWLVGPDNGIGWGYSPNYPYKEGAYFGNLFASNMPGSYCAGKDMGSGDAKGRMGSPFGNGGNILKAAYGEQYDLATAQNVPQYCVANNACTIMNEGYSQCADYSGSHGGPWMHPVTVWRNFESTQLYKICNKQTGKCLGVVGGSTAEGANIETRTFTSAAGQTWQILQVSPGIYKFVNKTSGRVLDINGSQVVQRAYTGATSQQSPLVYLSSAPGFANVNMASSPTTSFFHPDLGSGNDGTLVKTTTNNTADDAKWYFIAVSLSTFDPGITYRLTPQQATGKAIDVCSVNGVPGQTPGTCVQQYDFWNGAGQKFFVATDAAHGNVMLKMKNNANKCLGPHANGTTSGTVIEVQDCVAGSYNQSWITGEMPAGSGIFGFRNAAASTLCLDMTGNNNNNGAMLELYTCNSGNNQKFAVTVAP
jgi:hypothetical protein